MKIDANVNIPTFPLLPIKRALALLKHAFSKSLDVAKMKGKAISRSSWLAVEVEKFGEVKPGVQMKQHRHLGCGQPSVSPNGDLSSRQARCLCSD
jgi:hypothetical protein